MKNFNKNEAFSQSFRFALTPSISKIGHMLYIHFFLVVLGYIQIWSISIISPDTLYKPPLTSKVSSLNQFQYDLLGVNHSAGLPKFLFTVPTSAAVLQTINAFNACWHQFE